MARSSKTGDRPRSRADAHERALGLLAVRARSRWEIQMRLRRAGFEAEEIAETLSRLERVGLVDDEAFARQLVEHRFQVRSAGRRAVASELAAKGISPEVANLVLEEMSGPGDEERAHALAESRARRLDKLPPEKAFGRLSGLLMRRGFDPATARSAARRALELDSSDG
jgi:regulatory protein